jgi:hypothetical protein
MASTDAHSFPRLLVATDYAPQSPGGGLVLVRQMLRGWPVDRLQWWSCRRNYGSLPGQPVARHFLGPEPGVLLPGRRFSRLRAWLMERLWAPRAAAHLRQTLRESGVEVAWVIPQNWSIAPLAQVLPGGPVPFHVSVHDYPDLRHVVAQIGVARAARLARGVEQLYAAAASRDAISAPMREDLRQRTGAEGDLNRVGLEAEEIGFLMAKRARVLAELRLVFAGTIIAGEAFGLFVRALAGIRERLPLPLRLEFFGAHSQARQPWFDAAWMRERLNAPEPEFRAALRECAWGVAPVSLADEDPRYHRFSFPAKISSYLGAGLAVLALGHPQSSLLELARRHAIGLASTHTDVAGLQTELLRELTAEDPWVRYGEGIQRCVREEFDAAAMRARLWESLRRAAGRGGRT